MLSLLVARLHIVCLPLADKLVVGGHDLGCTDEFLRGLALIRTSFLHICTECGRM